MATFSNSDITFEKPYLCMIRDDIINKKKLKFIAADKTKFEGVVTLTPITESFIEAVNTGDILKINKIIKTGSHLNFFLASSDKEFKWSEIDKQPYSNQGGGTNATIETIKQERASLYAIEMSIKKNGFKNKQEFLKVCGKGLRALYPDMDTEWEETFYQQQITVYKEVGNTKFTHYSQSGDFMEDISKYVKDQYGISQKDTWNPADIWLVNKLSTVKRRLFKKIDDTVTNIEEFNRVLRDMYDTKEVVGISLKKISGKTALWENVNISGNLMNDYDYKFYGSICKLKLKSPGFESQDSYIYVKSSAELVKIQVKDNGGNLKLEGTSNKSTAARLGKAPVEMVKMLMKKYSRKFNNDHNTFPKDVKSFDKRVDEFTEIFNYLVGKTEMGIVKEKVFVDNMRKVFKSKPKIAKTKLMQLSFLYEFYHTKKIEEVSVSLVYLAMKKGDVFGPFAKLY